MTPPVSDHLTVGLAQVAPVWLDRDATVAKVADRVDDAAARGCDLVVFGEALVPGYPFWLERTDGARFESPLQQELHAHYMAQAVVVTESHLDPVCDRAASHGIAVYLGIVERPADRGGHSLYCSLVHVDATGQVASVHRKLVPTYEERLAWAQGDGHGLRTHRLGAFTVGGLNCWENWMPLPRAALQAQGEDLHVAVWPGSARNTRDVTRFLARESRSYVVSVSGVMHASDVPADVPHRDVVVGDGDQPGEGAGVWANGGSCVAAPDGSWLVEPLVGREELVVVTLDHARVREQRHNFDPSGHYARPDVVRLVVDRTRQGIVELTDPAGDDRDGHTRR